MKHGSLFSGIGRFDLAAEWAGWENVFHCEWNEFGQKVLSYHWPKAISYEDITKTDFTIHRGKIDILTGGFPCQPYSAAGKRLGKEDKRHLWPEMLRAIREIAPKWVVGENVLGLVNWNGGLVFDEVQSDLEAEGYEVQPYILPAASVGAPHRRDRVWFVAYSEGKRTREQPQKDRGGKDRRFNDNGKERYATNTNAKRRQKLHIPKEPNEKKFFSQHNRAAKHWDKFPTKSPICSRDDGFSAGLDVSTISEAGWRNESIKAYGNAIVPQVAYQIFKAINEYEHENSTRSNN